MPAGVCRAASRLQLQSVILNPEDKDDMSAHWISMLRDTDQTTPSEGAHILHRLCIHLEGGSFTVSLGKPAHPLQFMSMKGAPDHLFEHREWHGEVDKVRLCMLAVPSARSSR